MSEDLPRRPHGCARPGAGRRRATPPAVIRSLKKRAVKLAAAILKRIPVILKHSLRERNSWRIRLGLVVG